MKKKLIFTVFIYAVMCNMNASAQNSVTAQRPDLEYRIVSTLICDHTDTTTIACYNTVDGKSVFLLSFNNYHTIGAELSGYYINDMKVVTQLDSVFFCGYKIGNDTTGIIGHFDISDVFFGSGSVYIQDVFSVGDVYTFAREFKRLVSYYKNDNSHHVVCIGKTQKNFPCIVDLNVASYGGYTGGYVPNNAETFTDIMSMSYGLRDYLVTSGIDSRMGSYISMRLYDKENVISTPGIQDYIRTFCSSPSDLRIWHNKEVLLSLVNWNTFSTVSYRWGKKNTLNVHLAFYDMDAFVSNSHFSMIKSVEIPMFDLHDSYAKLHRYLYMKNNKLVFLHQTSTDNQIPYTYCEVDYPALGALGTLDFYGDPFRPMQGLTRYNGTSRYLMSGFLNMYNYKFMYEMETYGNPSSCVESVEYVYEEREPMASTREQIPFVYQTFISAMMPKSCRIKEVPLYIDCIE